MDLWNEYDPEEDKVKSVEPNLHLKMSLRIIQYCGGWPPTTRYRSLYICLSLYCGALFVGTFILSLLGNLIWVQGDAFETIVGTSVMLTCCLHIYKMFLLLSQQKRIQALLDATKSPMFTESNTKYHDMVSRYTWRGILHHVVFQSMGMCAVLCWTISPIVSRNLPLKAWYPFDTTPTSILIVTSLHQIIACMLVSWHTIAIDCLINGFITVTCCQFAILARNIATTDRRISKREIKSSNNNFVNRENVENSVVTEVERHEFEDESEQLYQELKKCVKHCNSIFEFAEAHRNIFNKFIFSQLITKCMIISFTAYHITQIKVYSVPSLIGTIAYGLTALYQIFIYCLHGSELQYESVQVSNAPYSNVWWMKSARFKRAMLIIMERMQKPVIFKAGYVMDLSLETFVGIIKVSYSAFTLLLNINK